MLCLLKVVIYKFIEVVIQVFLTGNLLLAKTAENHTPYLWTLPSPFCRLSLNFQNGPTVTVTHAALFHLENCWRVLGVIYPFTTGSSLKPARSIKWTSVVSHQALHLLLICTNQCSSLGRIWCPLLWYLRTKIFESRYCFYQKGEFCIVVETEESC